jgi:transcriptional regulator with XRE-family HTH domain
MEVDVAAADIIAHQVEMYGEPLSSRFGRLLAGYGVSQSRLAAVIGLSPPMLSQLMSGQREKISNPAVLGRLMRLEELLDTAAVADAGPGAVAELLEQVAASRPTLATVQVPGAGGSPAGGPGRETRTERAARALADAVDVRDLQAAARAVASGPLADILVAAAALDRSAVGGSDRSGSG